ncbi:ABC transporter ATP-binding protein [Desulfuromonas sp. KJ2020]|uniref:ABC transporter ATP-binding protein n=1 Tax=Desulfuromonas sp. KJ2020 TaxID=2919173 RepID=UPI0020A759F3|nr:ABC transporter ATP-binding protein [Desulfuromonas sp. KJ2020]MCP3177738.1 ABC transporter ATP-binding protein [Desulfuromonas sp. KJ2020]
MALIQIQNLGKRYESEGDCVEALKHVDLTIEKGTFLGVMGASGSGKSTFLSLLGGLSKPSTGTIHIDGIDIYNLSVERLADFRREYLGFVFQSFNLVPYLTAMENVMLPLAVKPLSKAKKMTMVEKALAQVGLSHRQRHLPNQLSGGEQERVAIARALVNEPPLILADEPTGSLDSETSRGIMQLFADLNAAGQTIIMVTHNIENLDYFDRTIHLRDGRIVEDRPRRFNGQKKAV